MSTENVRSFFEKAKDSPELQQKVLEIYAEAVRAGAGALAELSKHSDAPFTAEEFLAAQRAVKGEMSESEMEAVAGGTGWFAQLLIDFIHRCDTPSGRLKPF